MATVLRDLQNFPEQARWGALTIGNFDGVHRGHGRIVEHLIARARQVDGPAVLLTFDPHPVRLLRPDSAPPPLTWTDRKAQLLSELGVDYIVVYPTDQQLLSMQPKEFFESIVCGHLAARSMVEGPNFFFGRDRKGDVEVLGRLCRQRGMDLEIVQPLVIGGDLVSSSRVRQAIRDGDVDDARQLLTRPYRIRGMITHGANRGSKIGFPTANVDAVDTLLPGEGVYAGQAFTAAATWPAAINVGANPTFGETARKVEVHLVGFLGSLYGQPLEVDFLARLRDIQPFDSVEDLQRQLQRDVQRAQDVAVARLSDGGFQ